MTRVFGNQGDQVGKGPTGLTHSSVDSHGPGATWAPCGARRLGRLPDAEEASAGERSGHIASGSPAATAAEACPVQSARAPHLPLVQIGLRS